MPENTITSTPLLDALRTLLLAHRPVFRQQRTFLRAQALILGHLFAFARRTITQALIALGLTEHDWSAFYRLFGHRRIDYERLSTCFFRETLPHMPSSAPYVAVVDGVQIPRSSCKMPGTSWLKCPRTPPFRPAPHRAQRFLDLAALLPRSEAGYSRALPLRMEPSFPEKAIPAEGFAPKSSGRRLWRRSCGLGPTSMKPAAKSRGCLCWEMGTSRWPSFGRICPRRVSSS